MSVLTINGTELEFDLFDADVMEKYETANQIVRTKMKDTSLYAGKTTAENMRTQCEIVDEFFDSVFGAGTAQKVFVKAGNLRERIEAFGAVADEAKVCGQEMKALTDKYSANRAQRRQFNQNKGKHHNK